MCRVGKRDGLLTKSFNHVGRWVVKTSTNDLNFYVYSYFESRNSIGGVHYRILLIIFFFMQYRNCHFIDIQIFFSFAYIEFVDKDSVSTASALDESLFRGRQIKV